MITDKKVTEKEREWCFLCISERGFVFWEVEWANQWASTLYVCVCVVVFTQPCLCAWAMPRPGLGGLSEISCKRITDHASLAYWFTAKNTYTYTQNLLLSSSFKKKSVCLSCSFICTHTHIHSNTQQHQQWVHFLFKECEGHVFTIEK